MKRMSRLVVVAAISLGLGASLGGSVNAMPLGADRVTIAAPDLLTQVQHKQNFKGGGQQRHFNGGGGGRRGNRAGGNFGRNAAIGVGGLAVLGILGAAAAANAGPGPDCYIARQPVYDDWGNYRGSRRVRVCE
jgi:hypothetical protein